MPVAARHLAAVPRPATRKKVDSIIRVTLSREFRVVWENSVGTDALVRPQRDSAAGKNSFGISIPALPDRGGSPPAGFPAAKNDSLVFAERIVFLYTL